MKRLALVVTLVMIMGNVGQAKAGLVSLYNPGDTTTVSSSNGPVTYYTLFQALNDVQVAELAVNYDPGPVSNAIPGYYWQVWTSDASGDFINRIYLDQGFDSLLGFGIYEVPADLDLQVGQYYIMSFQANNDPNYVALDQGPSLPFVTTDGNFQVDGSIFPEFGLSTNLVAQFSLDVAPVPEPTSLTLLGIGVFGVVGFAWRQKLLRDLVVS